MLSSLYIIGFAYFVEDFYTYVHEGYNPALSFFWWYLCVVWCQGNKILNYELNFTYKYMARKYRGASPVAQMVKNLPAMQETWVWSLGWEDPLEKGKATHSSILAWRIPWKEETGGPQSIQNIVFTLSLRLTSGLQNVPILYPELCTTWPLLGTHPSALCFYEFTYY